MKLMETFESGKNSKELGIDTTKEFLVVEENFFKKGDIITLKRDDDSNCPFFWNKNKLNYSPCRWSDLTYAKKSWKTLAVGDVLIDSDGGERAVLAILNELVFYSLIADEKGICSFETKHTLKKLNWKIKGEETDEVTITLDGIAITISRKQAIEWGLIKE